MADTINYGDLMHRAMRGLMRELLADISQNGLPGEHHFFITFDTTHKGVIIAEWLKERYPTEMTLVIQHWFENLHVFDDYFTITLNFGNNPEPLVIPFEAIRTFVDPSVEFGLRFEDQEAQENDDEVAESPMVILDDAPDDPPKGEAEVVSLDSFRK